MEMQTNLSKKDKTTIAVVLFAGLVFIIAWFLIRPTLTSITTISDKIEQAEITQKEYKNKIIFLSSAEAIYGKAVDDLNESTQDYYEIMDSSEIDRMVTSYVLNSGLFSENLVISMPKDAVEEKPYAYASNTEAANSPVNTAVDTTDLNSSGAETLLTPYNIARTNCTSTKSSGVKRVELTLTVTGTRRACQAFIDDICAKPAVRITSFSWDEVEMVEVFNEETGLVELKDPGTVRLHISFNLYMADVADYSAAVTEAVAGAEG